MLFNSLSFALFLPIVFALYWFVVNKSLKQQKMLLLVASYFFYACWDWRFLFLLVFSTLLDYYTGLKMEATAVPQKRKFWFLTSVIINIGFLGIFKYYNFFVDSFATALGQFGISSSPWVLNVILPVGISFYTFHGLSYVIDIYKKRIPAENNFIDYAVFVSFFPLLVAGPIERATHLLPQIQKKRSFNYEQAVDGLRQILWGLFKKIVIADQCATYADLIFGNTTEYPGSTLFAGALFFTFQIYADFSGYSDIALGTARLFGIDLLRNFAFPYFSRDMAEFWRRWHISLSTWFRDYLYIPLGGSKGNMLMRVRNILIIFIVSGFWHGANWTFIVWGFLNAVYVIPSVIFKRNRRNLDIVAQGKIFPSVRELIAMAITFTLTTFAWIFFRSDSVGQAWFMISKIFSSSFFIFPNILPKNVIGLVAIFMVIEWMGRERKYAIEHWGIKLATPVRWAFYYLLAFAIFYYTGSKQQFIYFQF